MTSPFSGLLVRNMFALYGLQALNYLAPLILIPYLLRVLGIEVYGSWMFAFAWVVIGRIFVSYGFDLTATRRIATLTPNETRQISEILFDVTLFRFTIWCAFTLALFVGFSVFPGLSDVRFLVLAGMLIVLSDVFFPVWLFQGREAMTAILVFRIIGRVSNLCLVFFIVKSPVDVFLVPVVEAITMGASSLLAFFFAVKRFKLSVVSPSTGRMIKLAKEGGAVFVSTVAVQFYTTVNVLFLGVIVGPASVAGYAIADRVYSVIRGLLGPFVQAIFPNLSRTFEESRSSFEVFFRLIVIRLGVVLTALGFILFFASGFAVEVLMGERNLDALNALRVFALSLPFAFGSFLGPMLVARGDTKSLMVITIFGGVIGVTSCPILVYYWGAVGAASAFLIVQIFNTFALMHVHSRKRQQITI